MRDIKVYTKNLNRAIDLELNRNPSFGCVNIYTSASHKDMDYDLFKVSIESITESFHDLDWNAINDFGDLRQAGLWVEDNMFAATKGVNTHKGLIFLQMFLALAFVRGLKWDELEEFIRNFASPLEDDYKAYIKAIIWDQHSLKDIRTYPLSGYEYLTQIVDQLKLHPMDDVRLTVKLISEVDDTTTVHRSDVATLRNLQARAKDILKTTDDLAYNQQINDLNNFYLEHKLSTGGVADMFTTIRTLEFLREDFDE